MTTYSLHGFAVDYDAYGRFLGVAPTTLTFTDLDGGTAPAWAVVVTTRAFAHPELIVVANA